MESRIVVRKDDDLYVSTWSLSQGFQVTHQAVKKLVNKHKVRFDRMGVVGFEIHQLERKRGKKAEGRKVESFLLNETQSMFLGTLLKNTDVVLQFKETLVTEFQIQRRAIEKLMASIRVNKQNAEWLDKRASGKIERRVETDTIKEFVEYAVSQGSQSASKYYMVISKMENSALFNLELISIKYANLRDVVSGIGLDALKMADRIVAKAIKDGMKSRTYYKDIFQTAKARVESFADSMGKLQVGAPSALGALSTF